MNPYRDIALRWTPKEKASEPATCRWTKTKLDADVFARWFTHHSKEANKARTAEEIHKEFMVQHTWTEVETVRYYLVEMHCNGELVLTMYADGNERYWVAS